MEKSWNQKSGSVIVIGFNYSDNWLAVASSNYYFSKIAFL